MNLQEAMTRCRTLVVDGRDGLSRAGLIAELASQGFLIRRMTGTPHHLDPTGPYRELLAGPGRLAVDGSIIRELVYGPLRHGRSRVTWIQALDFADAVAERDGALVHIREPRVSAPGPDLVGQAAHWPRPATPARGSRAADDEAHDVRAAYERAFGTLAQHVAVVTIDVLGTADTLDASDTADVPERVDVVDRVESVGTYGPVWVPELINHLPQGPRDSVELTAC